MKASKKVYDLLDVKRSTLKKKMKLFLMSTNLNEDNIHVHYNFFQEHIDFIINFTFHEY